jgi:hypothetical protein
MSLELDVAQAGVVRQPDRIDHEPRRRRGVDLVDWSMLGLLLALSLWTVALDLYRAHTTGLVWTHTDGFYTVDQMQYLAWVRSAAQHGLSANLFVLSGTPADYLQPAVLVSAGLTLLGVAPWLALLLWKPVAVAATFFAYRWYVRQGVSGTFARRAALVLAVFFGSYAFFYGKWGVIGDLTTLFLSWGYTFGLLAGALLVFALLTYDRTRERRRPSLVPGTLGAIAGLLHPWQGEMLLVLLVASEALLWVVGRWRSRDLLPAGVANGSLVRARGSRPPRFPGHLLRTPAVTVVLTGLPLLYYEVLGHADPSWELARAASKHSFSLSAVLLAIAPLLVPALFAIRPRRIAFYDVVTRVWLVAALAIWVLSASSLSATPLHAFQGISLPLAVLATEGVQRARAGRLPGARLLAVVAIGLLTVPATVELMKTAKFLVAPTRNNPNFITKDERTALSYLAHAPGAGGVLTRNYLGTVVPGLTGRATFMGDCMWSQPHCPERWNATNSLLSGWLSDAESRDLVRASGARFVLSDCTAKNSRLQAALAPWLVSARHFGCAAVYEVRPPAARSRALAESQLDAALRASGR